jgi:hypothetical protein
MQSRVDPGSQHSCCAASGQEKKGPNLISSRSRAIQCLRPALGETFQFKLQTRFAPHFRVVRKRERVSAHIRRPPTRRTDGSPMGGFTDLDVTGDEHAPEAPELRRSRS